MVGVRQLYALVVVLIWNSVLPIYSRFDPNFPVRAITTHRVPRGIKERTVLSGLIVINSNDWFAFIVIVESMAFILVS